MYIVRIFMVLNINLFRLFIIIFFNKTYNYKLLPTQLILYIIINWINNIKKNYNNFIKLFIWFIKYIVDKPIIKENYHSLNKLFMQFTKYIFSLLSIKKIYYNFKKLLFLIYNNLNKYKLKLSACIYKLITYINKFKINFFYKKEEVKKKIKKFKLKYYWNLNSVYPFIRRLYKWKLFHFRWLIKLIIYVVNLINNIKKNYNYFKKPLVLIYYYRLSRYKSELKIFKSKLINYFNKNRKKIKKKVEKEIKKFKHKHYGGCTSTYRFVRRSYRWGIFRSRQLTRRLRIRLKYPCRIYIKSLLLKTVRYPHTVRKPKNFRYLVSSNKTRRRFKWVVRRKRIKIRFYNRGYILIILKRRIIAWFKSIRKLLHDGLYIGRGKLYRSLRKGVKITLWRYLSGLYGRRRRRKYKKSWIRFKVRQKSSNTHYKENFYRAIFVKSFFLSFNNSINFRLNLKFLYVKNMALLNFLRFYLYKIIIKFYYKNFYYNFYILNLLLFILFKKWINMLIQFYLNYLLNFYIKIFSNVNWLHKKIPTLLYYKEKLIFDEQNLNLGCHVLLNFNSIQFKPQYYYNFYIKQFRFKFILNFIVIFFKCLIVSYALYCYYNFFWLINFFFNNFFFKLLISQFTLYKVTLFINYFIFQIVLLNYNKNIYYI